MLRQRRHLQRAPERDGHDGLEVENGLRQHDRRRGNRDRQSWMHAAVESRRKVAWQRTARSPRGRDPGRSLQEFQWSLTMKLFIAATLICLVVVYGQQHSGDPIVDGLRLVEVA